MCVSSGGQSLHVVFAACAIVDFRQHQDCNVVINVMTNVLGCDSLQCVAEAKRLDKSLSYIEV